MSISRRLASSARLALELPDISPITFPADVRPRSAVTAIAVSALGSPNEAIRARVIADCGFCDCDGVVVIAPALAEQEDIFMRAGRAVAGRLGHRVGLGPNHIGAQIPPVSLKGEGDAPGNSDEVLGLEGWVPQAALARSRAPMGIPQNEPKNTVVAEYAPHLAKDFNQGGDVSLRRRLEADLATAALIITQLKIRRAGHHALDRLIAQWNSSRIATDNHQVCSCRPRPGA